MPGIKNQILRYVKSACDTRERSPSPTAKQLRRPCARHWRSDVRSPPRATSTASNGFVEYDMPGRGQGEGHCRIHRLHMENDAGKLTHVGPKTLCDFNRAG